MKNNQPNNKMFNTKINECEFDRQTRKRWQTNRKREKFTNYFSNN